VEEDVARRSAVGGHHLAQVGIELGRDVGVAPTGGGGDLADP
jgi:hypothetical protein